MKKLLLSTALLFLTIGMVNAQCNASWSASVSGGGVVTFNNTSNPNGIVDYYWVFDDGSTSTATNPVHTYLYDGTYMVCLYMYGDSLSNPNCYSQFCDSVVITGQGSAPCSASFTATSSTFEVNDPVSFNSSGTTGSNLNYYWSFGDGGSSNQMNAVHYYNAPGVYNVCLTVWNSSGCADTVCQALTIISPSNGWGSCNVTLSTNYNSSTNELSGNIATSTAIWHEWNIYDPSYALVYISSNSSFSYYPTVNGTHYVILNGYDSSGAYCDTAMLNVNVTNASSASGCNVTASAVYNAQTNTITAQINSSTAVNHYWAIYDPGFNWLQNFTGNSFTYTPTSNGTYYVGVYGTDSLGNACDSTGMTVNVTNAGGTSACNADFSWWEDSVASTPTVLMFNLSSGNNLSYTWDFGDGNTSNLAYPTHTYTQDGIYLVCLTVDDGNGCTDTYCDSVTYVVRSNGFTINVIDPTNGVTENAMEISSLYPNPVQEVLNLNIHSLESGMILVSITDVNGKVVYQENANVQTGENQWSVPAEFEKGLYFLNVQNSSGFVYTKKFVKI